MNDQKSIDGTIALRLKEISDKFFILDNEKKEIIKTHEHNIKSVKKKLLEVQEKMQQYIFQLDALVGASDKLRIFKKKLVVIILEKITSIDNLFIEKKEEFKISEVPVWQCINTCPRFYQRRADNKIYFRSKIHLSNPKELSIEINNKQLHIFGITYQSEKKHVLLELPLDYNGNRYVSASYNTEKNILEIIVPLR